jgi:hypothetical protein
VGIDSAAIKNEIRDKYDSIGKGILDKYKGGASRVAESIILSRRQPGLYWMEHKIQTAFSLGRFSRADRLLEVGCTAGDYTMMLAQDGYEVVAWTSQRRRSKRRSCWLRSWG